MASIREHLQSIAISAVQAQRALDKEDLADVTLHIELIEEDLQKIQKKLEEITR